MQPTRLKSLVLLLYVLTRYVLYNVCCPRQKQSSDCNKASNGLYTSMFRVQNLQSEHFSDSRLTFASFYIHFGRCSLSIKFGRHLKITAKLKRNTVSKNMEPEYFFRSCEHAQPVNKLPCAPPSMEYESSLLYSQEPTTSLYTELHESKPHPPILFL
jgi:hypothetical protein